MLPARENPFAVERIERLLQFEPAWLELTWDEIMLRGEEMGWRGAVIGPHGSGKTTFLDAFKERLEAREFRVIRWFLNDEKPLPDAGERAALAEAAAGDGQSILFIDGSENFGMREWRRVRKESGALGGLFVTRHKKGMLPVFLETRTDPEMLASFARKLNPDFDFGPETPERIFKRCRGNLREALWVCYDLMSGEVSRSD